MDVSVREFKGRLSYYLQVVRRGTEVVVRSRNKPLARVSSVDEPLAGLPRIPGVIWAAKPPAIPASALDLPPVGDGGVAELIVAERDSAVPR